MFLWSYRRIFFRKRSDYFLFFRVQLVSLVLLAELDLQVPM